MAGAAGNGHQGPTIRVSERRPTVRHADNTTQPDHFERPTKIHAQGRSVVASDRCAALSPRTSWAGPEGRGVETMPSSVHRTAPPGPHVRGCGSRRPCRIPYLRPKRRQAHTGNGRSSRRYGTVVDTEPRNTEHVHRDASRSGFGASRRIDGRTMRGARPRAGKRMAGRQSPAKTSILALARLPRAVAPDLGDGFTHTDHEGHHGDRTACRNDFRDTLHRRRRRR